MCCDKPYVSIIEFFIISNFKEVVKLSMLIYIVHHFILYQFLECMLNASRKHRINHSVICQLILNIQTSFNIAYTDGSAPLLLLFFVQLEISVILNILPVKLNVLYYS